MNMNTEQSRALADLWVDADSKARNVWESRGEKAAMRAYARGVNAAVRTQCGDGTSVAAWVERHRTPERREDVGA